MEAEELTRKAERQGVFWQRERRARAEAWRQKRQPGALGDLKEFQGGWGWGCQGAAAWPSFLCSPGLAGGPRGLSQAQPLTRRVGLAGADAGWRWGRATWDPGPEPNPGQPPGATALQQKWWSKGSA